MDCTFDCPINDHVITVYRPACDANARLPQPLPGEMKLTLLLLTLMVASAAAVPAAGAQSRDVPPIIDDLIALSARPLETP